MSKKKETNKTQFKEVTFDGQKVRIEFADDSNAEIIAETIDFLFDELEQEHIEKEAATFIIEHLEKEDLWKLTRNNSTLFNGKDINGLGTVLAGEVLFNLIEHNDTGMAIHAGLVSNNKGAIMLPADSGSGKSSVTTWLLTQGYHYHTDELVMINLKTDALKAFKRPVNIKTSGLESIGKIFDLKKHESETRKSAMVTMINHRAINPKVENKIPALKYIVFPHYSSDNEPSIQRLSGAEGGLEMMRSNVIARNIPGHGFGKVIGLVKNIPTYRLHYQHFDNLKELFAQIEND